MCSNTNRDQNYLQVEICDKIQVYLRSIPMDDNLKKNLDQKIWSKKVKSIPKKVVSNLK